MRAQLLVLSLLALPLLAASCGAQWQALDPIDPHSRLVLQEDLRPSPDPHGHRDFARTFEPVWRATIEGLHASGVPVPDSARDAARASGSEVLLELDVLWLQVVEREPGRTCVLVRYRGYELEPGRAQARTLLDEIQRRL
jgi:hypothetical protein